MMVILTCAKRFGFYGFANWVPTLLVKQGIDAHNEPALFIDYCDLRRRSVPLIGLVIGDKFERKSVIVATAAAIVGLRPGIQSGFEWDVAYRHGRRANAGKQHYVLQLSCLPNGAFPDKHSVKRGGFVIPGAAFRQFSLRF